MDFGIQADHRVKVKEKAKRRINTWAFSSELKNYETWKWR